MRLRNKTLQALTKPDWIVPPFIVLVVFIHAG
jgi:hypothetical protein